MRSGRRSRKRSLTVRSVFTICSLFACYCRNWLTIHSLFTRYWLTFGSLFAASRDSSKKKNEAPSGNQRTCHSLFTHYILTTRSPCFPLTIRSLFCPAGSTSQNATERRWLACCTLARLFARQEAPHVALHLLFVWFAHCGVRSHIQASKAREGMQGA